MSCKELCPVLGEDDTEQHIVSVYFICSYSLYSFPLGKHYKSYTGTHLLCIAYMYMCLNEGILACMYTYVVLLEASFLVCPYS